MPLPTTVLRRGDELLVVTDPVRDAAERRLRAVGQGGKLAGWLGLRGQRHRTALPTFRTVNGT